MSYGNRGGNRYGGGRGGFTSGGGSRYGNRDSMGGPKPVEVGKEYSVEVTEISRRGDGVAKVQGFIIFVKGAKVGDKVRIKVESVGPRFATASVVESTAASNVEATSTSPSPATEPSA